ncbi:hypothetical protein Tco_1108548 [Tanacetum coccineum]
MYYTLAQDEGKADQVKEKEEGTVKEQGTDKPTKSTDKPNEGTDSRKVSTDRVEEGTAEVRAEQKTTPTTPTQTQTTFGDEETIAHVLLNMSQAKAVSKEKEKGVEIKEVERPRVTSTRSVLTLQPLPKIDPKDKGKKRIEEDDELGTESDEISTAKKKLAKEEATNATLIHEFDDIKARIKADRLLALRLQEEREQFTIEERVRFLHDTIKAQRKFLAQQRAAAIRSKPPTKTQLRNQMKTFLKHVGNKKHLDLKNKTFEEIQALYEKVKKGTKKRKGGHIKMKSRKRRYRKDTSLEDDDNDLRLCLIVVSDEDREVEYEIHDKKYPIIEWKSMCLGTKPQYGETEEKKYPLKKEVLSQMLELKLETEEDSNIALDLIRFVKKQIEELDQQEPEGVE